MEISHTEKLLFERTLEKLSQAEKALGEARMDMHMLLLQRQQLSEPEQSVSPPQNNRLQNNRLPCLLHSLRQPHSRPASSIQPGHASILAYLISILGLRIHLSNPRRSRDPQFNQRLCTVHKQIFSHPGNQVRKRTRFFRRVPDGGHRNRSL